MKNGNVYMKIEYGGIIYYVPRNNIPAMGAKPDDYPLDKNLLLHSHYAVDIKSNILIKNLSSMTNIMDIVCGLREHE